MITPDEAVARLNEAESAGRLSRTASANVRRWLTEGPFAKYRPRLLEDIEQGRWPELDNAFFMSSGISGSTHSLVGSISTFTLSPAFRICSSSVTRVTRGRYDSRGICYFCI